MMKSDRLIQIVYTAPLVLFVISLAFYVPRQGISVVAVAIVSFFLGFATKAGYLRVQGHKVRVPIVERSRLTFSLLVVVMLSLSLVSIFQLQRVVDRSEHCNQQFRTALTYNASLNVEQANFDDEIEDQLGRRRDAFDMLINTLGPSGVASPSELVQYKVVAAEVEKRVDEVKARKAQARKDRAPYPAPTCGVR